MDGWISRHGERVIGRWHLEDALTKAKACAPAWKGWPYDGIEYATDEDRAKIAAWKNRVSAAERAILEHDVETARLKLEDFDAR